MYKHVEQLPSSFNYTTRESGERTGRPVKENTSVTRDTARLVQPCGAATATRGKQFAYNNMTWEAGEGEHKAPCDENSETGTSM